MLSTLDLLNVFGKKLSPLYKREHNYEILQFFFRTCSLSIHLMPALPCIVTIVPNSIQMDQSWILTVIWVNFVRKMGGKAMCYNCLVYHSNSFSISEIFKYNLIISNFSARSLQYLSIVCKRFINYTTVCVILTRVLIYLKQFRYGDARFLLP